MTIASPASKISPTLSVCIARMMFTPRPGPSMTTVITTIDRASMIVWLTASPIVLRASGSSTLLSTWPAVEPRDRAASRADSGTPRIPRAVIRMAAGIA